MTVVSRYREHFSYAVSEPENGQSNALNKGLSRATGDILVNSDDRLAPGALHAIAPAFHNYSMDYELWARFAACGTRIYAFGTPIARYRMHPEQKTSTTEKYTP